MLFPINKTFSKIRAGIYILALAIGFLTPSYSSHYTAFAGVVSKAVKA
jgi:hypothetical protein